jgi:hypothetical protein
VWNAEQEAAIREHYLRLMEAGIQGRNWYTDAGGAIRFYANDLPERAYSLAEDLSITSQSNAVNPNTGMGVKGYNQGITHEAPTLESPAIAVNTGRFPTAQSKTITEAHMPGEGGVTGKKRMPFTHNMARGGGFLALDVLKRAVHDIWEGEALLFTLDDGTAMRRGYTDAEHAWMDKQVDLIIDEANRRKLGGFDDWNESNTQAASWIGAKVQAGQMKAEDASKSYAAFFEDLVTQGSRETTPGKTTGHLPELLRDDAEAEQFRDLYAKMVTGSSGAYDELGRDQIAAGFGGLTGAARDAPGVFEGRVTPGRQTRILTGSEDVKVGGQTLGRVLDEGSRRIMDAAEATWALLTGQDAAAYSRLLPAGPGVPRTSWDLALPGGEVTKADLAAAKAHLGKGFKDATLEATSEGVRVSGARPDVTLDDDVVKGLAEKLGGTVARTRQAAWDVALPGGQVTRPQVEAVLAALGPQAGGKAILVPLPDGIRLSGMSEDTMKQVTKDLQGTITERGTLQGNYIGNDWKTDKAGQQYFDAILKGGRERFDAFAPAMAQRMRDIDAAFHQATGGKVTLSPIIDQVRKAIAEGGFAGLEAYAKQIGVPVVLLLAGLAAMRAPWPPAARAPSDDGRS